MILFLCVSSFGFAQAPTGHQLSRNSIIGITPALKKKKIVGINVKKTGPYFGLKRGLYLVPEAGVERQWKRIKFKPALTHAVHMGFNYNFK